MYQAGRNAYINSVENTVEDKRVILIKLYEGAIKFINFAKRGINEKSPRIRGENISKVMAIVTELDCALDMERGGNIASNLRSLYGFVMNQLTAGNIKNDLKALDNAENILRTLKEGFEEAYLQQKMAAKTATASLPEFADTSDRKERLSCAV